MLSLVGSNFNTQSKVLWNGTDLPTAYVNSSLLTAQVPASAIAAAGPHSVTVANPGAGASNANKF
jgi:hypothetical protein